MPSLAILTLDHRELFAPILMATSLAVACAVLSVFVVWRRWAFIGEGISHSGFGGAGTVWLLMAFFPALERMPWMAYLGVVAFCLCTAIAIGYFTRAGRINSDAAIGIFLVASLAWGILAQHIFLTVRHHNPVGWDTYLFGQMDVTLQFAIIAAAMCAAIVAAVGFLGKEIVAYSFDPVAAEAAGVRVAFVHYLLMILVAIAIVIAARIAGTVMATALLVLPGAAALLLSQRLAATLALSLGLALLGTVGGLFVHFGWHFVPTGPAIVLLLFVEFLFAYGWERAARA